MSRPGDGSKNSRVSTSTSYFMWLLVNLWRGSTGPLTDAVKWFTCLFVCWTSLELMELVNISLLEGLKIFGAKVVCFACWKLSQAHEDSAAAEFLRHLQIFKWKEAARKKLIRLYMLFYIKHHVWTRRKIANNHPVIYLMITSSCLQSDMSLIAPFRVNIRTKISLFFFLSSAFWIFLWNISVSAKSRTWKKKKKPSRNLKAATSPVFSPLAADELIAHFETCFDGFLWSPRRRSAAAMNAIFITLEKLIAAKDKNNHPGPL